MFQTDQQLYKMFFLKKVLKCCLVLRNVSGITPSSVAKLKLNPLSDYAIVLLTNGSIGLKTCGVSGHDLGPSL